MTKLLLLTAVFLALLHGQAFGTSGAPGTCKECPGKVWYVSAKSQGSNLDGQSWATAFRNLQQALGAANTGDCIWVARGRYFTTSGTDRSKAFVLDRSLRLYGGFAGNEKCLNQRAGLFQQTYLSGEIGLPGPADNAYNVIRVSGPPPPGESFDILIDGFNISDANNDFGTGEGGGIMFFLVNKARIENCIVRNNKATYGAGIHVRGGGLDVVRTQFIANQASKDGGAFFSVNIPSAVDPSVGGTLHNVVFKDNTAVRRGGGFYCADMPFNREMLFVNALFRGNSAKEGGAGYLPGPTGGLLGYQSPGNARLVNATVVENSATNWGAAFAVEDTGPLPAAIFIENGILWDNFGALPAIGAQPFVASAVSFTLLQSGSPWACVPSASCTVTASCNNFACNPLFGVDHHPLPNSPAVAQGWPLLPPDRLDLDRDGDRLEPIPLDLDDLPRTVGALDRGCYEYQ